MFKWRNNKLKGSHGFTIMEIVVVVFIISLSLTGIMSLVVQNVQVEYINKNMIMASQLVQEGLELVRNKRDNNWLAGSGWKTGIIGDNIYAITIDSSGAEPVIATIDVSDINDAKARLYIDDNGYYANLNSPDDEVSTAFFRIIEIKTETAASTTVECLVQWQTRNNTHGYSAQTVLYDWR